MIKMPYASNEYCGSVWAVDELTKHFRDLGFTNIVSYAVEPEDDDYQKHIYEVYIERGLFGNAETWEANDEFKVDSEISIYYNSSPVLTVDNCNDLVTVLTSKNMSYKSFADKYDGCYVEFNAYVTRHTIYDGGTSHIIDVTGGDYDGKREIDVNDETVFDGLIIRIGDRTWNNFINKSVEPGDHVFVSGRIDASWSEYYKQLYIETMQLYGR